MWKNALVLGAPSAERKGRSNLIVIDIVLCDRHRDFVRDPGAPGVKRHEAIVLAPCLRSTVRWETVNALVLDGATDAEQSYDCLNHGYDEYCRYHFFHAGNCGYECFRRVVEGRETDDGDAKRRHLTQECARCPVEDSEVDAKTRPYG
ncbi:hypothetical protein PQR20_27230 [Paraburkholderia nemoris]